MKVHPSNYAIAGFTAAADPVARHASAGERGVPLADDLGSGSLVDLAAYGLPPEPTVRVGLERADVVTFSGDKLLGAAVQCGIVDRPEGPDRPCAQEPLKARPARRQDDLRGPRKPCCGSICIPSGCVRSCRPCGSSPASGTRSPHRPSASPRGGGAARRPGHGSVADCISQIGSGALRWRRSQRRPAWSPRR